MNDLTMKNLIEHADSLKKSTLEQIISRRKNIDNFIIETNHIFADFNRNFINFETIPLIKDILIQTNFSEKREKLFTGGILNQTENRSVDHIALRNSQNDLYRGKPEVKSEISDALGKIKHFTELVHNRKKQNHLIGEIETFVHIGIGGSDLGPRMVVDALEEFKSEKSPDILFISSVDPYEIKRVLKKIDLSKTVFINVSKSLTTPETLQITHAFIKELENAGLNPEEHLLAITANKKAPEVLPVHIENCFFFPESIGGRYSLWSTIGLVISIFLGYKGFQELLDGASQMDRHFFEQEDEKNLPVMMGFLEFWYFNIFNSHFHTINFYTERLRLFPLYLQQLAMESNGKSVNTSNQKINYFTAGAVFGSTGTSCQHSFFQALHQGRHFFHSDFIGLKEAPDQKLYEEHYDFLFANMMAQAETLMLGYHDSAEQTVPVFKEIEGSKPSNVFLLKKWSPEVLGSLLALYEHKTFVLGALWDINSFDQWGVERGKKICSHILNNLDTPSKGESLDPVTLSNLEYYKNTK